MDVEAVGRQVEVQKEREREVDWTLKRSEPRRKSKGVRNSGGLDVEAVEATEKVPKEQVKVTG